MIEVLGGIFQSRGDILVFQIGIIAQDFRTICTPSKHVENIGHANALAANARPSAKHLRI